MIDVLKRLAELDANNPNVDSGLPQVKSEQAIVVNEDAVAECGMMPEMGMMGSMTPPPPPTPATINITAGSGEELSDMLTTILTLAGQKQHDAAPQGEAPPPAVASTDGDESPTDSMRSVIDKLNPMDDEESDEEGEEDNQEDADEGFIGRGLGGEIGGSIGDVAGTALGTAVGGPLGGFVGGTLGDIAGTSIGAKMGDGDKNQKETDEELDNTPNDPTDTNEFDANQFAHHENQPGQGDRMDGTSPKAYATMEDAVADLFAQYKKFVKEA